MRQWTLRDFKKILELNGYHFIRSCGSHLIYENQDGNHITIPHVVRGVVAYRIIKENKLKTDI